MTLHLNEGRPPGDRSESPEWCDRIMRIVEGIFLVDVSAAAVLLLVQHDVLNAFLMVLAGCACYVLVVATLSIVCLIKPR